MPPSPIYALPTLLTLGNLLCGFFAVMVSAGDHPQRVELAAGLIFLAMLLDGVDGLAARRLDAQSRFGELLDCLADLVSFGVAPAVLLLELAPSEGFGWWAGAAWLVAATALRLARYATSPPADCFEGLPCPAAAGVLAGAALAGLPPAIVAALALALGLLMVSKLRYPRPADLLGVRRISFATAALLALGVALAIALGGYAPLAICVLFVVWPLGSLAEYVFHHKGREGHQELDTDRS